MIDALVIGGGPAGLATSRELSAREIPHVVLERGPTIAHTWENLYDGLVLHTGKHFSALPGLPFPKSTPIFPRRRDFLDYLARYSEQFRVPVTTSAEVDSVDRAANAWRVHVKNGSEFEARAVVVATGIVANPLVPTFAGMSRFAGAVMHSVGYRRPQPFAGERILVVGAGNSAGEISVELAAAGARVTIAVRNGAPVVPLTLLGIPVQYFGVAMGHLAPGIQRTIRNTIARVSAWARSNPLPRGEQGPCAAIPLIGFHLVDAIREGCVQLKPGIAEFTSDGVQFTDGTADRFDRVILATGYRAALGFLSGRVHTDPCGFAARRDRVVSADQPDLYLVGHNYDTRGGLRNIGEDARLAASRILRASSNTRSAPADFHSS